MAGAANLKFNSGVKRIMCTIQVHSAITTRPHKLELFLEKLNKLSCLARLDFHLLSMSHNQEKDYGQSIVCAKAYCSKQNKIQHLISRLLHPTYPAEIVCK